MNEDIKKTKNGFQVIKTRKAVSLPPKYSKKVADESSDRLTSESQVIREIVKNHYDKLENGNADNG